MEVSSKYLKPQKRFHAKQYEDSIKNVTRTKNPQKMQMTMILTFNGTNG